MWRGAVHLLLEKRAPLRQHRFVEAVKYSQFTVFSWVVWCKTIVADLDQVDFNAGGLEEVPMGWFMCVPVVVCCDHVF